METYVGMVIGTGSHRAPGFAEMSVLLLAECESATPLAKSLRLRKIVDSLLPCRMSR